jgi:hypothetical protein
MLENSFRAAPVSMPDKGACANAPRQKPNRAASFSLAGRLYRGNTQHAFLSR